MFRGRKRKLPSFFVPEPCRDSSETEDEVLVQVVQPHEGLRGAQEDVQGLRAQCGDQQDPRQGYQQGLQDGRREGGDQEGLRDGRHQGGDQQNLHQDLLPDVQQGFNGGEPDPRRGEQLLLGGQQNLHPDGHELMDAEGDLDPDEAGVEYNIPLPNGDIIIVVPHDEGEDDEQEGDPDQEPHPPEEDPNENEDDELYSEHENEDDLNSDEENDYESLLESFSKKWLFAELDHTVSKTASDVFWKIATNFIPKIIESRNVENIKKKIPQFHHIRRKMYDKHVPKVNLEISYRDKNTNEITVVHDTVTPKSRFPPNRFEKLCEIASVEVLI